MANLGQNSNKIVANFRHKFWMLLKISTLLLNIPGPRWTTIFGQFFDSPKFRGKACTLRSSWPPCRCIPPSKSQNKLQRVATTLLTVLTSASLHKRTLTVRLKPFHAAPCNAVLPHYAHTAHTLVFENYQ